MSTISVFLLLFIPCIPKKLLILLTVFVDAIAFEKILLILTLLMIGEE